MRWRHKALIQKTLASTPGSDYIYRLIQKKFGTLDGDPWFRLPHFVAMLEMMQKAGFTPIDKTFLEVGTGHKPIMPICFFLAGADKIITVDLNRRIDSEIVMDMLALMKEDAAEIKSVLSKTSAQKFIEPRLNSLFDFQGGLAQLLETSRIKYLAPGDAAHLELEPGSIDCHFSTTTLEHIPLDVLRGIFQEAHRLMHKDAIAAHFIDLSDHYQHQDSSITKINFLKYSDRDWHSIAGNKFGYTNRLRASQFRTLFEETGFDIALEKADIDKASLKSLKEGFKTDQMFSSYDPEDLCTTSLRVILKKKDR